MIIVLVILLTILSLQVSAAHVDVRFIIVDRNGDEYQLHHEPSHRTFTSWLKNVTSSRIKQGLSYGICNSKIKISDLIGGLDGTKYTILQLLYALSNGDFAYSKLLLEIAESHNKAEAGILINWLESTFQFPSKDLFVLMKNTKLLKDSFNISLNSKILEVFLFLAERNDLFERAIAQSEFSLANWLLGSGYKLRELSKDTIELLWSSEENELLKESIENLGEKNTEVLSNFSKSILLKNETFLKFLMEREFFSTIDYLVNSNGTNIELVLSAAIDENNKYILDNYIERLPNIDRNCSSVLLHSAVESGQVEVVKKLVELGSDLEGVDKDGKTPLYKALELEKEGIVEALIEGRGNRESNEVIEGNLLSTAVLLRDHRVARKLIKLNASCLEPDPEGLTPLQRAIENNDTEMVVVFKNALKSFGNMTLGGKSPVHIGILKGSSEVVEKLLEFGAAVDLPDENRNTPLCLAAWADDKMKILLLAEYGAMISEKCSLGNTPLHIAVSRGSYSMVRVLVALGADVNITNNEDQSPLYVAAVVDSSEIIAYLISKGGYVHFSTHDGDNVLHGAAMHGSTNALDTLLGYGIDVNAANKAGESPIYVAVKYNKPSAVALLASKGANILETFNGDTLLHAAVDYDNIDAMIALLKLGLSPETLNKMGQSSLTKAILSNSYEMVWKILNNTASSVFSVDVLLLAASNGRLESMRALTDYLNLFKLKISSEDPETGWTPLSEAVKGNHDDVVRFLIKNGGNIYYRSKAGDSLAHFAAMNGSTKALRVLYEFGLPLDSPNDVGETPLWLAAKHGHFDIVKLLYDLGADMNVRGRGHWEGASLLLPAAFSGNDKIVVWLLSRGFPIDDVDFLGVTALQEAASCGQDIVVQLLLDKGAEVDKADINGMTPLHKASYNGHAIVAYKLVTYGASLNVPAVNLLTPLHQAARNGHLSVVKLLCDHKADLNAQDIRGWTSLHWAAYKGHTEVARHLATSGAAVTIKSIQGETPIEIAMTRKHYDVENVLTDGSYYL